MNGMPKLPSPCLNCELVRSQLPDASLSLEQQGASAVLEDDKIRFTGSPHCTVSHRPVKHDPPTPVAFVQDLGMKFRLVFDRAHRHARLVGAMRCEPLLPFAEFEGGKAHNQNLCSVGGREARKQVIISSTTPPKLCLRCCDFPRSHAADDADTRIVIPSVFDFGLPTVRFFLMVGTYVRSFSPSRINFYQFSLALVFDVCLTENHGPANALGQNRKALNASVTS